MEKDTPTKQIPTVTLEQLKSQAYDCIVQVETWNKRLQLANQAIRNYKPEPESKPDTNKVTGTPNVPK